MAAWSSSADTFADGFGRAGTLLSQVGPLASAQSLLDEVTVLGRKLFLDRGHELVGGNDLARKLPPGTEWRPIAGRLPTRSAARRDVRRAPALTASKTRFRAIVSSKALSCCESATAKSPAESETKNRVRTDWQISSESTNRRTLGDVSRYARIASPPARIAARDLPPPAGLPGECVQSTRQIRRFPHS